MTGAEFKEALAALNIKQHEGKVHFGKSERTIRRYCSGEEAIPQLVAEKVERLMAVKAVA